jgi:uncharacterized peroxidase-related enzyme
MSRLLLENEATGKAAQVYGDIQKYFGMVPNFFKAQAAIDADWLELNWKRLKHIMLSPEGLDRKTRELIAYAVSAVNQCEYCKAAHENTARAGGATDRELVQTQQIVELFCSFNAIADTLNVPLDGKPQ